MKKIAALGIVTILSGCSMFGYNHGVKEPAYSIVQQDDCCAIREYPLIVMASTSSDNNFDDAQSASFYKLFDYISGKNSGQTKINMTAPVVISQNAPENGSKIDMTAPVMMTSTDHGWTMSFVLPAEYTLDTAPKPLDPSVTLSAQHNIRYAVLKFSGFFTDKHFAEKTTELQKWLDSKGIKPTGPAIRAGYNPPFTLPMFRRNEVLIPVAKAPPSNEFDHGG